MNEKRQEISCPGENNLSRQMMLILYTVFCQKLETGKMTILTLCEWYWYIAEKITFKEKKEKHDGNEKTNSKSKVSTG